MIYLRYFDTSDASQEIACATRRMLLDRYLPRWAHFLAYPVLNAVLDDRLRTALAYPTSSRWFTRFIHQCLRWRSRIDSLVKRRSPKRFSQLPYPTYPLGYQLNDLGPAHLQKYLTPIPDQLTTTDDNKANSSSALRSSEKSSTGVNAE